jgi:hypothetical protein
MQVAKDAMAGPDDRGRLALDQLAIGILVAGQDGVDDGAIAMAVGWRGCAESQDVLTPLNRTPPS